MPSSFVGLLLFVVLLVPGFAFLLVRERRTPERRVSAFRETAVVACVSVAADSAGLVMFALLRAIMPSATPDIDVLVRDPSGYLVAHYGSVAGWGLIVLSLSVAFAVVAGSRLPGRLMARVPFVHRHMLERPTRPRVWPGVSGWWLLFTHLPAGTRTYVGCVLSDGAYVAGWLHRFSHPAEDVADRDLTLAAPIYYRAPGQLVGAELSDLSAVSVSARQLTMLTVSYLKDEDNRDASPDGEAASPPVTVPDG